MQNNLSTSSLSRWTIKYIGKTQLTTHTTSSSSINNWRISISSILLTFWLDYSTCFAEIVSNTSEMSCSFDKLLRIFRRKKKNITHEIIIIKFGFTRMILLHKFLEDFLSQLDVEIQVLFRDDQGVHAGIPKYLRCATFVEHINRHVCVREIS